MQTSTNSALNLMLLVYIIEVKKSKIKGVSFVYENIKSELAKYYFEELPNLADEHRAKVFEEMDKFAEQHEGASSYFLKAKMYDVIAENVNPQIFADIPFHNFIFLFIFFTNSVKIKHFQSTRCTIINTINSDICDFTTFITFCHNNLFSLCCC